MKKILSFILSVVMVCGLISAVPSYALSGSGTKSNPYVVSTYPELREVIANAPTDGSTRYIKLGSDITSQDIQNDYALTTTSKWQDVVLDLAGKKIVRKSTVTIDPGVIRAKEGKLTINDSVGTGGVYAQGKIASAVCGSSSEGIYVDNGTIIINGGTYESAYLTGQAVFNEAAKLYINGGTFRGTYGLYVQAGATYVYGGEFYSSGRGENKVAVSLQMDQKVELYNFTAHGIVNIRGAECDIWSYINSGGKVSVDGVNQARTTTKMFEGETVILETPVTCNFDITVDEPTPGKTIYNRGFTPFNAPYYILKEDDTEVFNWFEGNSFASGTFKKNTVYRARMKVKVEGHVSPFATATVNGNEAVLEFVSYYEDDDYSFYWVEYTFPETIDNELNSAAVTVTQPTAGATATNGTVFTSSLYEASVYWSTTADLYYADFDGKTFEAGKVYYADVYVTAKDPYIFIDGSTINVNGQSYAARWSVGSSYKKYICVLDIPFTVGSAGTAAISYRVPAFNGVSTALTFKSNITSVSVTAANGVFYKANVQVGVYRVYAKQKNTLRVSLGEYNSTLGEVTNNNNVTLPLGDVNGDDVIDISDISLLLATENYGKANTALDLTGDTFITVDDISTVLQSANYGKTSVDVI